MNLGKSIEEIENSLFGFIKGIYEFFNLQDKTNWYIWMFSFFLLGFVLGLSKYNKSLYDEQKGREYRWKKWLR